MVNESYRSLAAVNGDAPYDIVAVVPALHVEEGVAVDNLEIFHFQSVYGIARISPLATPQFLCL